ncbi:TlpA family protein disulfide reductase [Crocinitomix sp.]|nr:TlpA family protein disulfide reductase [Crocinitomix sp.]
MQKSILIILLLSLVNLGFGQNNLKGFAPDFIGKTVKVYTYQDYVTMNRMQIGEGIVEAADSSFHIKLNTNTTIKAIVEIERTEASLYIAPKTDYFIYFPASEKPVAYVNSVTNIYFSDLDTTDINYRILEYHQWFDTYIALNQTGVAQGKFLSYLDSFKLYVSEAYKDVKDPYFITYVRYDIGEMEQTYGGNRRSQERLKTYLEYIEPFPIYYENDRYMKFLLAFYDKEFREYLPVTEKEIMRSIFKSSPTLMMQTLKSDIFLAKPELRELVMIDKLGKAYYREIDFRPNIITILDSISEFAQTNVNSTVAANVKDYITKLEPGYPAPAIRFETTSNEFIGWSHYTGKFVYFNFFATWSDKAVNDMEIMTKLVAKYNEDIDFVTVCTDKDILTYKAFMKQHPEYNWDIFYIGENSALMNDFKVATVPSYYLIDQDGFIFSAPALAPSPNGKYQSIEITFREIQRALHPEERVRVGEK